MTTSGQLSIYTGDTLVLKTKNTVLPAAREVIVNSLANVAGAKADDIALYNGVTEVSAENITSAIPENGNEITYTATFGAAGYVGDYTAVRLRSTVFGNMAEVVGLTLTKGAEDLVLIWKLIIN